MWMDDCHIDGLRLDAADCIDPAFFRRLKQFCEEHNPDFWLMGEIIHGDYNRWANPDMLDSVTNYECYKGLYSSHNEKNYFEIAYSLNRQFGGNGGIYKDLVLYDFVDNHDVNRLASTVKEERDLANIYTMLYAMPGICLLYTSYSQLDELFPKMKEKYIKHYGSQYALNSPNNIRLMKLFHQLCEENDIIHDNKQIFEYLNLFERKQNSIQLSLFD